MSITIIGLDTAKSVFQVHGLDETGKAILKKKLQRSQMVPFFEKLERCTIYLEECGAGHHWARILIGLGHDAKLIAPEKVTPFVKKGKKKDPTDAAALTEAGARPDMKASARRAEPTYCFQYPAPYGYGVGPKVMNSSNRVLILEQELSL